jgi:hypothetical protein
MGSSPRDFHGRADGPVLSEPPTTSWHFMMAGSSSPERSRHRKRPLAHQLGDQEGWRAADGVTAKNKPRVQPFLYELYAGNPAPLAQGLRVRCHSLAANPFSVLTTAGKSGRLGVRGPPTTITAPTNDGLEASGRCRSRRTTMSAAPFEGDLKDDWIELPEPLDGRSASAMAPYERCSSVRTSAPSLRAATHRARTCRTFLAGCWT